MKRNLLLLVLLFFPAFLGAQSEKLQFTDVTKKAGIDFRYTIGDYSYVNIIESSGSGITVFDYNNDGLMDLFLMNGTWLEGISDPEGKVFRDSHNELYENKGDGTFMKVTQKAGLGGSRWSMAAGAIDIDNDGDQDLFLLNYGPNIFYRNNGNGTFTDITEQLGLAGPATLNGFVKWSIGVSFWDYNRDGRLDAMTGNFLAFDPKYFTPATPDLMPHPSEYKGQASILYEQKPDGKFVDVTEKNRLYFPDSKCMGLTVFDYDDDGDLDIFQANDHQLNFLFRNDRGVYRDVAVEAGVAANSKGVGTGSMHASIGDINGDGLIDILVTDLAYGALYLNKGNGLYADVTESSGAAAAMSGKGSWGAVLFDFDNDGDLDIAAANGTAEELILQYPILLENDGKGHFRSAGAGYGKYFTIKRSGRGLAVWDYDNDGDLDLIISHVDKEATAALLRNDGGNKNHWLGLTLLGEKGPATAIAARVTVITPGGKQVLVNQWTTSYLSNNDQRLHIGLGRQNTITSLEILWNDGKKETYRNLTADRYLTIREGAGIIERK